MIWRSAVIVGLIAMGSVEPYGYKFSRIPKSPDCKLQLNLPGYPPSFHSTLDNSNTKYATQNAGGGYDRNQYGSGGGGGSSSSFSANSATVGGAIMKGSSASNEYAGSGSYGGANVAANTNYHSSANRGSYSGGSSGSSKNWMGSSESSLGGVITPQGIDMPSCMAGEYYSVKRRRCVEEESSGIAFIPPGSASYLGSSDVVSQNKITSGSSTSQITKVTSASGGYPQSSAEDFGSGGSNHFNANSQESSYGGNSGSGSYGTVASQDSGSYGAGNYAEDDRYTASYGAGVQNYDTNANTKAQENYNYDRDYSSSGGSQQSASGYDREYAPATSNGGSYGGGMASTGNQFQEFSSGGAAEELGSSNRGSSSQFGGGGSSSSFGGGGSSGGGWSAPISTASGGGAEFQEFSSGTAAAEDFGSSAGSSQSQYGSGGSSGGGWSAPLSSSHSTDDYYNREQTSGNYYDKQFAEEALDAHNSHRAKHGAIPLVLDDKLSAAAQSLAERLAAGESFGHSAEASAGKYGENLAVRSGARVDGWEAVDTWYMEHLNYNFGNPKLILSPPSRSNAEFTAVVWNSTRKLGIGKAVGADGRTFVVANYYPPGNTPGKLEDNVFPPKPVKKLAYRPEY